MENFVRVLDRNLVYVNGIEEAECLQDDSCIFITKRGVIKIFGANLEVLKLDMQNKTAVISGTIYDISY